MSQFLLDKSIFKDLWDLLPEDEDTFMVNYVSHFLAMLTESFHADQTNALFILLNTKDDCVAISDDNIMPIHTLNSNLDLDDLDRKRILVNSVRIGVAENNTQYVMSIFEAFIASFNVANLTKEDLKLLYDVNKGLIRVRDLPKHLTKEVILVSIVNKNDKSFSLMREIIRHSDGSFSRLGKFIMPGGTKEYASVDDVQADSIKPEILQNAGIMSNFWAPPEDLSNITDSNFVGVHVDTTLIYKVWDWGISKLEQTFNEQKNNTTKIYEVV